jgi:hypothetical protein
VIRQLRVDELDKPVTSTGSDEQVGGIFQALFFCSDLPADERAFCVSGRRGQTQNRDAIFGGITDNRLRSPVGLNQLIESNDRNVKWREIPSETGVDSAASVWIELNHTAAKNGACRHSDPVLDVDRIEQAAFQWFPSLHGNVLEQFNR